MTTAEKIIITGIAGTSVMTGSSYAMSAVFNKNFKEPEHLTKMIKRLFPDLPQPILKIFGWAAHYAMGLVFASIYVALWEHKKIKPTLANAMTLGVFSGILGWLIWKASFKYHPFSALSSLQTVLWPAYSSPYNFCCCSNNDVSIDRKKRQPTITQ